MYVATVRRGDLKTYYHKESGEIKLDNLIADSNVKIDFIPVVRLLSKVWLCSLDINKN